MIHVFMLKLIYNIDVLGPITPIPSKINNYYFRKMYIKIDNHELAKKIRFDIYNLIKNNNKYKSIMMAFDIEK